MLNNVFKILVVSLVGVSGIAGIAYATHSWGGYHWARAGNPFTVKLGKNVSAVWLPFLATTSNDWSISSVLDATMVAGRTRAKTCRPTNGQVEVCSERYGSNGWLGVANIWVNGTHITQGTVRVNDTYFSTPTYNTTAWRNLVMCQEVGHTFGLDHQDENFNNPPLGTCMDYTSDPTLNQHPNQHDYDMLGTIYAHLDTFNTLKQSVVASASPAPEVDLDDKKDWGKELKRSSDGKASLHERDLGKGHKVFTFVIWVQN